MNGLARCLVAFTVSTLVLPVGIAMAEVGEQKGQLPTSMRVPMEEGITITVGQEEADLIGNDNRVLQAAVDYVAALGGGTVIIGPGTYRMEDSLHVRGGVTVRGQGEATILRKPDGYRTKLFADGDYGEEQITLVDPTGFALGKGVAVADDSAGGFHITVGTIVGRQGNTFAISQPLGADCMVHRDAWAATIYPVVSVYHTQGVRIEGLTIDGNRENNAYLNGCRGAGIFLYRGHGTVISNCTIRRYNGDGISFQQSNDVQIISCACEENGGLGLHPGSGSQRPVIRDCRAEENDRDGLYLCWRVQYGLFENNTLIDNGRDGISIGHKDSDNLFQGNLVEGNHRSGVRFRNESEPMAGHRNRLEKNRIFNNGGGADGVGILIDGVTNDIVLVGNVIGNTSRRPAVQKIPIRIGEKAGPVVMEDNEIEGEIEDRRASDER